MSIFDDDNEDVKRAIHFFNQLSSEEKIKIVSDLNPFIFQQKTQYEPLFPLLSKIQHDISKSDAISIGNKLMDYGLDETYARLFVSNVKNHAPTEEYQLSQIEKIPDDDFCKKLPDIVNGIVIYRKNYSDLSNQYGIDMEKSQCIVDFICSFLNLISRGEITMNTIRTLCKQHLSDKKTEALTTQISRYEQHWSSTLMFRNIQDAFISVRQLIMQNQEILNLMKELVDLKKKESLGQTK